MSKPFIDSPDIMSASVDQPKSVDLEQEDSPALIADETPAEEPVETTDAEESPELDEEGNPVATPGEDAEETPGAKPRRGVQTRIDELTRGRYEAQRDRDYWRDLALRGGQPRQADTQAAPAVDVSKFGPPPKLADYAYDEKKYNEAIVAYNDKIFRETLPSMVRSEVAKTQRTAQEERVRAEVEQIASGFQEREVDAATRHADYEAVAHNPDLVVSDHMSLAIQLSEKGPDIAYFLGKNPAESARIARLHPVAQAAAIGRIEARFSTGTPRKTTSAPAPVKPVGSKQAVAKRPEQMSTAEYRAWRAKQS